MRSANAADFPPDVATLVEHIAAQSSPVQIVLFGSHVSGHTHIDSDVDLLVVTETNGRPLRRAAEIYRSLPHDVPIDILVRSPEQMRDPSPRDLILTEILKHGVTVYETSD